MTDQQVQTLHYVLYGTTAKTTTEKRADLRARWNLDDEADLLEGEHLSLVVLTEVGVLP